MMDKNRTRLAAPRAKRITESNEGAGCIVPAAQVMAAERREGVGLVVSCPNPDNWKNELRGLGHGSDFQAFSLVIDRTYWTGCEYRVGALVPNPFGSRTIALSRTLDHIRRLRHRGHDHAKLREFTNVVERAHRDAYLRETLHLLCRRAGLSEEESLLRVRRAQCEGAINLPAPWSALAEGVFEGATNGCVALVVACH